MDDKQDKLACKNLHKPVIEVKHSDLKRSDDSMYRSDCPTCGEGLLLVYRNVTTLVLEEFSICTLCGQQFRYLDIDVLRKMDGMRPMTKEEAES